MKLYIKKPIPIEAFQMTKERGLDNSEWPAWLHRAWNFDISEKGALFIKSKDPRQFAIKTLEGDHDVTWGDYIIKGVRGEFDPCKADIFEETYEEVQSGPH